jgi:hypothetical protein
MTAQGTGDVAAALANERPRLEFESRIVAARNLNKDLKRTAKVATGSQIEERISS